METVCQHETSSQTIVALVTTMHCYKYVPYEIKFCGSALPTKYFNTELRMYFQTMAVAQEAVQN